MLTEKRLLAIPPQPFTADGTANGVITVADASIFRVRQIVQLQAAGQANLSIEVKRILGPTTLLVGQNAGQNDYVPYDISMYTVAAGATVEAIEQQRPIIPQQNIERITYEDEPVLARRVVLVDKLGNIIEESNPLPVDAVVTIPSELAVRITAEDNDPNVGDVHSSVRISDGTNQLHVNSDGSINANVTTGASMAVDSTYNEVTGIANGATVTVATYTAQVGFISFLQKIDFSGDSKGTWEMKINGTTGDKTRTYYTNYDGKFLYSIGAQGLSLAPGDVVDLVVTNSSATVGMFNGRIQVSKV